MINATANSLSSPYSASLILVCPDQAGIVAELLNFFAERQLNLIQCSQFSDDATLFARLEWTLDDRWEEVADFNREFETFSKRYSANFDVHFFNRKQSVGLFVGNETHALVEFLNRNNIQDSQHINVPFIISDDEAVRLIADRYGLPFFFVAIDASTAESVIAYEKKQLGIINRYKPDCLGFANYDAVISPEMLNTISCSMVRVKRSFMPNFEGKKAFKMAHQNSVKVVGATAHFILRNSQKGPIIAQDTASLKQDYSLTGLVKQSYQIEQAVFVEAMSKVLEHKTIVHKQRAIVFA